MLFITLTTSLLASLAVSTPTKRQSQPNIGVELTNTVLAVTAEYNASTDGTAVPVDSTLTFNQATLRCLEVCIPEYHCTLFDKSLNPIVTLNPGGGQFDSTQVGQITCGQGLVVRADRAGKVTKKKRGDGGNSAAAAAAAGVESARAARAAAQAARVVPYDGAAVFTDNRTGWETGFGFYLGQTVSLGDDRTQYYSSATVQDVNAAQLPIWSCRAFGTGGENMGVFWASEKFIYSFVPGVVASFLCG